MRGTKPKYQRCQQILSVYGHKIVKSISVHIQLHNSQ